MKTPRIDESVESIARALSQSVRTYSGYGQYENKSPEQEAYLNGVETAIGMMYIDLTGSPKSKGVLKTLITQAEARGAKKALQEVMDSEEMQLEDLEDVVEPCKDFAEYKNETITAIRNKITSLLTDV